ncbi:MAG: hypothetical protein QNL62_01940 [Gammaproteobacteria bacterium]|nr:hypothetical protein [Gammaproteobacteria bacterium]
MLKQVGYFIFAFFILGMTACTSLGPSAIKSTRGDYNIALQQTNNEQLLLNIVRLKYRDNPTFLQLTSVTTSFTFQTEANADTEFKRGADPFNFGANIIYADKPTVSYTPLQGDKFVTEIMSPFKLNTLSLLYHSGWSVERILALTAQNMNNLKNAPSASGPTPERKPKFEKFKETILLMRELQMEDILYLGAGKIAGNSLVLYIKPKTNNDPRVEKLRTLLGLKENKSLYPMSVGLIANQNSITINPRSLMGVLFYVSQAVEVPERDIAAGRVTRTLDDEGNLFDWSKMLGPLIRIRSSMESPDNAYVAIRYRKAWFYIDDSDLSSKSTFSLLTQLSALSASGIKSEAPVLTLPIGN